MTGARTIQPAPAPRPQPLQIGNVIVDPPLVLAPMAGVTDEPYRRLMERYGVGMVVTEMVSAEGLRRNQPGSWKLLQQDPHSSVPLAVQLFGADPEAMAEAARMVEEAGASIVDINAGCPVKKVVRQGAGARLLKTPDHLERLVESVKKAVGVPVTVKIRLGWDKDTVNVLETVQRIARAGADAVTIHARTATQYYGGKAHWSWIGRAKAAADIPVIGNGDITSPSAADRRLEQTACDAVMIGRGTMGNPWLAAAIAARWGRPSHSGIQADWNDFARTVREHLEAFRAQGKRASGHFRKILMGYSKGLPGASGLRARLMETDEPARMLRLFQQWVETAESRGEPFLAFKVPEANAPCPAGEARRPYGKNDIQAECL